LVLVWFALKFIVIQFHKFRPLFFVIYSNTSLSVAIYYIDDMMLLQL